MSWFWNAVPGLGPITLAYETYGTFRENNVILILHALSGDSHAAGYYSPEDPKPGWWDSMVGPGKGIDTDKYFVICSNILGSCMGSTGPSSHNPKGDKPYGLDFPVVTVGDMVTAQKHLLDHLGVKKLLSVIGGLSEGCRSWIGRSDFRKWSPRPSPWRQPLSIRRWPSPSTKWPGNRSWPIPTGIKEIIIRGISLSLGLAVARMIGHITYLSDESMRLKFGRRLQDKNDFSYNFDADFQVESYLRYQGTKFVERFDANSFLYITKAADYFDLGLQHGGGSTVRAFSKSRAKFLVVSFTSDWLYPTYQSKAIVRALKKNGLDVSFCEIEAEWGHDAFLLPSQRLTDLIKGFLDRVYHEI